MRQGSITVISAALLLVLAAPAAAQPAVFTRINQSGGFRQEDLAVSYSIESKHSLADYEKSGEGGGGGGGGLGGQSDYQGVTHHINAAFGVTDWLTISVDQTLKQPALDDLDYGVLAPELRLDLNDAFAALERLPVELSTYVEGRVRVSARRRSSVVLGAGADRRLGPVRLSARCGFETTMDNQERENGARYEIGASYPFWSHLALTLEAWGSLVWPEYSVFQQDHHGGPSVGFFWGPVFAGVSVGAGVKERPHRVFVDLTTMGRVGVRY